MTSNDPIETIERTAYDAWPAEEVESLAGWRLRALRGVSRRANSVWTFDAPRGTCPSASASIGWSAGTDREISPQRSRSGHGLAPGASTASSTIAGTASMHPSRFKIATATTDVQAAARRGDAIVSRNCSEEWFEISAHRGRFAKVAEVYRALLTRIGPRARFAVARIDGHPACVGLGVIADRWMGVFSMLTLPAARRRGAAGGVLHALAETAREEGVESMYLQVERENAGANALYAAASFQELYGYHYRVLEPG